MTLWRYALVAFLVFTIIAKHALSLRYDGSVLDYVYAIPSALIPLGIAVLLSLRTPAKERTADPARYAIPTIGGLAFIGLIAAVSR